MFLRFMVIFEYKFDSLPNISPWAFHLCYFYIIKLSGNKEKWVSEVWVSVKYKVILRYMKYKNLNIFTKYQ